MQSSRTVFVVSIVLGAALDDVTLLMTLELLGSTELSLEHPDLGVWSTAAEVLLFGDIEASVGQSDVQKNWWLVGLSYVSYWISIYFPGLHSSQLPNFLKLFGI